MIEAALVTSSVLKDAANEMGEGHIVPLSVKPCNPKNYNVKTTLPVNHRILRTFGLYQSGDPERGIFHQVSLTDVDRKYKFIPWHEIPSPY